MIDHIRDNAQFAFSLAQKHPGRIVGYDWSGIEWLDGYIQKLHNDTNPASEKLISLISNPILLPRHALLLETINDRLNPFQ
jgi:hypothetical protein